MSIIFQKVYRPFFTHTHTTSSSSNTQFSYVFVISTTQHSRSVQMWVKPCFASTPSIHGGGASVHTLAFFFIRNTHTHTRTPHLFFSRHSRPSRPATYGITLSESGFRSCTGTISSPPMGPSGRALLTLPKTTSQWTTLLRSVPLYFFL